MKKLQLASLALLALAPAPAPAREMTATDLVLMRRLGAPTVSPDRAMAVFALSETDLAGNRRRNDLWMIALNVAGANPVRLTGTSDASEHDPRFSPDGDWLYFLSGASGSEQVWRMRVPSGPIEQVTRFAADVSGFAIAPTGDRIAIWADRNMACADLDCANVAAAAAGQGSGRVYDEIFVRHWDTWIEPNVRSRIFVLPMVDGRPEGAGTPVAPELVGDSPSKPFGGGEEIAWSADGRTLYFALRLGGRTEPTSTNLDIYAAAEGAAPVNLTAANRGMDTSPAVSPDGRWLAWTNMARAGYEADRQVIHLRNLSTGEVRVLTGDWDRSVGSIAWAPDGRSLLVTAGEVLDTPLFRVDVASGRATRLTQGGTVGNVTPLADGSVVFTLNSLEAPDDLYRIDRRGRIRQVSRLNQERLAALDPVSIRRFSFAGANGDRVWGQIIKPADASERLPLALLIHGGPQSSFGNAWSYRWNPRLFAAPGYAAVTIDFHGSSGYGQAFTDAINRNWGGSPLEDLRLGVAALASEDPAIDTENACALGGSYGGYMVNWIAGAWPEGFDCLVSHSGILDQRAMAYETEELWFTEWEFGGPYYEHEAGAEYERHNPVRLVGQWRTPMLVIHGERDFRIPYSQSLGVFNALQRRGIPSRLVVFPDENHWILKPQNSIQWYREVHGWLDRWLRRGGQD